MSLVFEHFALDQERRQLLRSGAPVPLEAKAFELLSLLVARRPRVLSKAEIRDVLWPGIAVGPTSLPRLVTELRQALGDDAHQPRFVRTVHGLGYAFCGEARESADSREPKEVLAAEAQQATASAPPEAEPVEGSVIAADATASAPPWRIAGIAAAIVVVLGTSWFAIWRTKSWDGRTSVEAPRIVPLTSLPGAELHPALSPDGTRVAFIWDGPNRDNYDVYVKDIASGEMVRVTKDPAPDYRPAWSPDGKHLAFLRERETGAAVFLVSVGGQEQRLTDIVEPRTYSDLWSAWVHWLPDGRFVAVADRVSDGASWGIVLVSIETGEKTTLTANAEPFKADLSPTFSPDGLRLAFLRGRPSVPERWDLLVQPLSSDTPPVVRGDAIVVKGVTADGIGAIVWLPTSDELVAGGQRISLDGSPPRPFGHPGRKPTDQSDIPMDPVSVRGARLAFDTPEPRFRLMRVPLAGDAKAPLAPFFPSTRGERDPAFAPDGRKVAFTSGRSGDYHIWIADADGSTCRELPLPPGSKFGGSPSWSPDGRRLAFDADVGGTWHVYVATPEGGTLRRLTSDRTSDARARWSRDGRFIYFASTRSGGDWQIWKARADAGDAEAVQVTRSGAMEAEESFDGRYVYYAKRWVAGVFRVPLDVPEVREEKVLDFAGEGRWHLGARGILALDLESGRPTIRSYEFASGATSMVLELPLAPWDFPRLNRAFTASPDERWALIATLQVVESDIMLLEGFR